MAETSSTASQAASATPARAYLALGAGLLILGISPILIRAADAPGPVSSFYRMGIGWLVLSGLFLRRKPRQLPPAPALRWAALAGLFFGLDMTFWSTGIMLVGATKPTLLANTTPLWVGLGAIVFYKERHKPLFWVGLAAALAGAVLIVGRDIQIDRSLGVGSLFGLISAFFYSSFFLAAQRGRKLTDSLAFVWISTLVSTVLLFIIAVILRQPLGGYSGRTYLIFVLMGFIVQAAGWLLIGYAQGHLPASIISPTLLGQPVLTGLFAFPLFGEVFQLPDLIGAGAVMGGVLLVHYSKRRKD